MTPEHKNKLLEEYREFSRLKELCLRKGEIEIMIKMSGIKVLKNTENTKALKTVIDNLKPGGFKWEAKNVRRKSTN